MLIDCKEALEEDAIKENNNDQTNDFIWAKEVFQTNTCFSTLLGTYRSTLIVFKSDHP